VSARLLILVGGILASSVSRGGPLSMDPSLGVATEYSSNPYLVTLGGRAVQDVAVIMSAPTRYDLDSAHFALTPSVRYSSSGSYASLNSNYLHLDGSGVFADDLNLLTITAGFGRDSSLQQSGLSSNGLGVRSDGSAAGLDWQRTLTERLSMALDASWNRVLYNQGAELTGLLDYRYVSFGSTATYAIDKRDKFKMLAGAGEYTALDGVTKSKNYNLQTGFDRQLSELWTASVTAGYARSDNTEDLFFGPFLLATIESEQKGPVYNASLVRAGEQLKLTLSASRTFRPSGFEFLSRQDMAEVNLGYTYSERWKFGMKADYQNTNTPLASGLSTGVRYFSGALSADWNWTPTWIISLRANWVSVKYELPPEAAQSTGVSLEISRQFLRIDL
jgi:hypothetical protein